jgi:hypothetical protein
MHGAGCCLIIPRVAAKPKYISNVQPRKKLLFQSATAVRQIRIHAAINRAWKGARQKTIRHRPHYLLLLLMNKRGLPPPPLPVELKEKQNERRGVSGVSCLGDAAIFSKTYRNIITMAACTSWSSQAASQLSHLSLKSINYEYHHSSAS